MITMWLTPPESSRKEQLQTPEKPGGRECSRCTGFAVGSDDASIGACEVSVQRGNLIVESFVHDWEIHLPENQVGTPDCQHDLVS